MVKATRIGPFWASVAAGKFVNLPLIKFEMKASFLSVKRLDDTSRNALKRLYNSFMIHEKAWNVIFFYIYLPIVFINLKLFIELITNQQSMRSTTVNVID